MADNRKSVARRTIEALRSLLGCKHEWVPIRGSGPHFGGFEDKPMLFSTRYRCKTCGARKNTVKVL